MVVKIEIEGDCFYSMRPQNKLGALFKVGTKKKENWRQYNFEAFKNVAWILNTQNFQWKRLSVSAKAPSRWNSFANAVSAFVNWNLCKYWNLLMFPAAKCYMKQTDENK